MTNYLLKRANDETCTTCGGKIDRNGYCENCETPIKRCCTGRTGGLARCKTKMLYVHTPPFDKYSQLLAVRTRKYATESAKIWRIL